MLVLDKLGSRGVASSPLTPMIGSSPTKLVDPRSAKTGSRIPRARFTGVQCRCFLVNDPVVAFAKGHPIEDNYGIGLDC